MLDEPSKQSVKLFAHIVIRAVEVECEHSLGDGILRPISILDLLGLDRNKMSLSLGALQAPPLTREARPSRAPRGKAAGLWLWRAPRPFVWRLQAPEGAHRLK